MAPARLLCVAAQSRGTRTRVRSLRRIFAQAFREATQLPFEICCPLLHE